MKSIGRILLSILLVGAVLAASFTSVQAGKRVYKASFSSANELHQVVGTTTYGSMVMTTLADGTYSFKVTVRGLTSDPTGGHIHGPATETENAPVIGTLCGAGPNPGFYSTCTLNADGLLVLEGHITGNTIKSWGLTLGQFQDYLEDGLLYANFHTALNPAGEARGQIYRIR